MTTDKLIVTNRSALQEKYGTAGLKQILAALKKLIAADKKKGLTDRLAFLDEKKDMAKVKGRAVIDATDPEQNKAAIDALFRFYQPDYLLLAGAQDVIPHCRFRIVIPRDDDNFVPSDTPYACEAAFSREAGDFIAPSRVVGRLPDITGSSDPSYFLSLIDNSIRWKPLSLKEYDAYFSMSVQWWESSTRTSLRHIFEKSNGLLLSPPSLGPFNGNQLAARVHFFNCHGGYRTPEFYGQKTERSQTPVCFQSSGLAGKISFGTVVAAECCYGGLLYNPYRPGPIDPPICNTYLREGAMGFAGSTTAAYGPSSGQGAADYITQYFLISIRKGASLGRAFLEARQRFVEKGDVQMDPMDLKTIIQFLLLGDPSITPVEENPKASEGASAVKTILNPKEHAAKERKERRLKLGQKGAYIASTSAAPRPMKARPAPSLKRQLSEVLKTYRFDADDSMVYGYRQPRNGRAKALSALPQTRYHLYGRKPQDEDKGVHVLVVQEVNNKVMEVKEYVRK